jgi:hypothetical protein
MDSFFSIKQNEVAKRHKKSAAHPVLHFFVYNFYI